MEKRFLLTITRWTQKLKTQVTLGRVDASEE